MGLSPASSRGSGGTFNGGTITEKLSVTPAAGDTPYIGATAPSGAGDLGDSLTELIGEGDGYFAVDALGTLYSTSDADGTGQTLEHGTTQLRLTEDEISLRCFGVTGVAIFSVTPGAATIRAQDGGLFVSLPTVDPAVVGQLWNSAGTVKVSAG